MFYLLQIFQVAHNSCVILKVIVIRGENVTKGLFSDMLDTPDPYVLLNVPGTPNGHKYTRHVNNCMNPVWKESFTFYLNYEKENVLDVTIIDANVDNEQWKNSLSTNIGKQSMDLKQLQLDKKEDVVLTFNNISKLYLNLHLKKDTKPDLRYSLELCEEEKQFLKKRNKKILKDMKIMLGAKAPKKVNEVPVVAILGSGGGFRALVALSGIMTALAKSGIMDIATYTAGVSGSTWYLSTLYSHPDFPSKSPGELQAHIRECVSRDWKDNLREYFSRYASFLMDKMKCEQTISFTDFFGCLLGDILLPDRQETKLSDMQRAVSNGKAPFPLFASLHVKKNVSAKVFQEWVEFSPYEIGMAKYGAFMKVRDFGSRFYMGHVLQSFPECPLLYFQGMWGSAFCIRFKRLMEDEKQELTETLRENMSGEEEDPNKMDMKAPEVHKELDDSSDLNKEVEWHSFSEPGNMQNDRDEPDHTVLQIQRFSSQWKASTRKKRTMKGCWSSTIEKLRKKKDKKKSSPIKNPGSVLEAKRKEAKKVKNAKEEKQTSLLTKLSTNILSSSMFDTRAGRAELVFNPLKGLPVTPQGSPEYSFEPTSPLDTVDFKGLQEPMDTKIEKLYIVDAGLAFNSPYPLLLQPERSVNLFLSFDFSERPSDDYPPFQDLLMAEKWAEAQNISFPPVSEQAKEYMKEEGVKEAYVFRHPTDIECPTVIHFPIVNNLFRKYKAPGILRNTEKEKEEGDFNIFGEEHSPYSLFNFHYPGEVFDRLAHLMEFNALQSVDVIKGELAEAVKRKKAVVEKQKQNPKK